MTDLLGVLRKTADGTASVHYDRYLNVDPHRLWEVLTHPGELGQWFAEVDGDLVERGEFTIAFGDREPEKCRVMVCTAPRTFTFEWKMPQPTLVTVHVMPDSKGARFELTHERLTHSNAARYAAGWDSYLHVLSDHLSGAELRDWSAGADAVRVAYGSQIIE